MNTKQKVIIGLSAFAAAGALAFGICKYKQSNQREKILKALKQHRLHLSKHFVGVAQTYEQLKVQCVQSGIPFEKMQKSLQNNDFFKQGVKEAKENAFKETGISEEEYNLAINDKYKNDQEIQDIVEQLKNGLDLLLKGERNFLGYKNLKEMDIKEFIRHHFKVTMLLTRKLKSSQFEEEVVNYAKKEGFFVDGYHPSYILLLHHETHFKTIKPAIELFGNIFENRKKQFSENPDSQFDDEKDVQEIYKKLGLQN